MTSYPLLMGGNPGYYQNPVNAVNYPPTNFTATGQKTDQFACRGAPNPCPSTNTPVFQQSNKPELPGTAVFGYGPTAGNPQGFNQQRHHEAASMDYNRFPNATYGAQVAGQPPGSGGFYGGYGNTFAWQQNMFNGQFLPHHAPIGHIPVMASQGYAPSPEFNEINKSAENYQNLAATNVNNSSANGPKMKIRKRKATCLTETQENSNVKGEDCGVLKPASEACVPLDNAGQQTITPRPSSSEISNLDSSGSTTNVLQTKRAKVAKKPAIAIPDELKDEAYWNKRKKNNESAKRSRLGVRTNEAEGQENLKKLERENDELKADIAAYEREIEQLRLAGITN